MTTDPAPDPMIALARGLAVFALPPGGRAAEPGWPQRCTIDPESIARTWTPGSNVGVSCRASGVVGIDLDRHDDGPDGVAAFARLCHRHGQDWPDTLTVRTAHGGRHLYFRMPAGVTIGSTAGGRAAHGGRHGLGPGIDTRGPGRRSGGYLIGPSSLVDGARYVIERDTAIAVLPAWLTALLAEPEVTGPLRRR